MVVEMAKASATGDPRFFGDPITPDELPNLDIEISVLSPLKKTTDPLSLRLGIDGIYIKRGYLLRLFPSSGGEETGWTKEEFLSYCCSHKAGLPAMPGKTPKPTSSSLPPKYSARPSKIYENNRCYLFTCPPQLYRRSNLCNLLLLLFFRLCVNSIRQNSRPRNQHP